MNRTRLTPYPANPSASVPAKYGNVGNCAPSPTASAVFVVPATRPLIAASTCESAAEILRVRLLSTPQHRQAAVTASKPADFPEGTAWVGQASNSPPRKIATKPNTT